MKRIAVAVLGLMLCGNVLLGDEHAQPVLRARPIQIVSRDTLPEEMRRKLLLLSEADFQIFYLLEGTNIAGVDSLVIDTIKTPDGVDVSKDRNGRPTYALGYRTNLTPDRKYGVFCVNVTGSQFGKVEKLEVKGHVVALIGSRREEKTIEVKATGENPLQVGPFTIKIKQEGKARRESGLDEPKPIQVTIAGPQSHMIDEIFKDGNEEIHWPSSFGSAERRVYSLAKPKRGKLTLTLSYWLDLKEVKVPLSQ
jgi:hypothetical protein